jgi:hypothetical protein
MELRITPDPPTWSNAKGTTYETKFVYTGSGRIDTHSKTYQVFQLGPPIMLFERPFEGGVVSRVYSAEFATVTEYSKTPRRWKEETPESTQYFEELRRNSP